MSLATLASSLLLCLLPCIGLIAITLLLIVPGRINSAGRIFGNLKEGVYRKDARATRRLILWIVISTVGLTAVCLMIVLATANLLFPSLFTASQKSALGVATIVILLIMMLVMPILAFLFYKTSNR